MGSSGQGVARKLALTATPPAAQANAARALQDNWWRATVRHLDNVTVRNSVRTDVWNRGGSDDAGFVQIRCDTVPPSDGCEARPACRN